MEEKNRIIVALDVDNVEQAIILVKDLIPYVKFFKIGLELITAVGAPIIVNTIHSLGGEVFYDGKFDDIPNTVGAASKAVSNLNVKMFDIHASAGIESLRAAVANKGNSLAIAVTVLTALEERDTQYIFGDSSQAKVLQFAQDAQLAGCDGIVCSSQELELLAGQEEFKSLIKVVPGIRPQWAKTDDQKRIMTPAEAIRAGANYIVIGRPIINPPAKIGSPVQAIKQILEEIRVVL